MSRRLTTIAAHNGRNGHRGKRNSWREYPLALRYR
jgi:hypothetical protein